MWFIGIYRHCQRIFNYIILSDLLIEESPDNYNEMAGKTDVILMFTGTPTLIIGDQISGVALYISRLKVHIVSYKSSIIFVTSNFTKMLKSHSFL